MQRRIPSFGDDGLGVQMQATMKQAELEVEKLREKSFESDKKFQVLHVAASSLLYFCPFYQPSCAWLQEMINRVSQLQLERGKLMHQLQASFCTGQSPSAINRRQQLSAWAIYTFFTQICALPLQIVSRENRALSKKLGGDQEVKKDKDTALNVTASIA